MQKVNHENTPAAVQRHPFLMRILAYAPIVLASCCFFPLRFPAEYLDGMILFLLLITACNLGSLLAWEGETCRRISPAAGVHRIGAGVQIPSGIWRGFQYI